VTRSPIDWHNRPDLVERLRVSGDDAADRVVAAFDTARPDGQPLWPAVVAQVRGHPGAEDADIDWYLREGLALPSWVDEAAVRRGQAFFEDRAWSVSLALLLAALPLSYCGADGARVLERTGRLNQDPRRRVFETALLLLELARPGSLEPGQPGHLTVRRLRLLHATVRRLIFVHGFDVDSPGSVPWDVDQGGCPVSQLDLLGTLWNFALTPLAVFETMGLDVTSDDRRDWIALWNVVGELLGIADPEGSPLLPMDEPEARACFEVVKARQFAASSAGVELTTNLRTMVKSLMPFDWLADGCMRHYLGPVYADMAGVPRSDVGWFIRPVRWVISRDWARRRRLRTKLPRRREVGNTLLEAIARWHAEEHERGASLRTPSADDGLARFIATLPVDASAPRDQVRLRRSGPRVAPAVVVDGAAEEPDDRNGDGADDPGAGAGPGAG
jgi:hypothetical protein